MYIAAGAGKGTLSMRAYFFLFLLSGLLLYGSLCTTEVKAEENLTITEQEDLCQETTTVTTAEELARWLAALDGNGGQVTLGAAITIEDSIFAYEDQANPIRICTGSFGLIYDGGSISTLGVELIGEGVDMPVLEIRGIEDKYGWFQVPDWNKILSDMDVTATGRDGLGGVAVLVTEDKVKRSSTASYEIRGRIHSYGEEAVGLMLTLDHPVDIYFLDIDVEGTNACAVTAPSGADVFGCSLSALGKGAVTAAGNGIVLDTCLLSSEPEDAKVISRTIERIVGLEPQIKQNIDYRSINLRLYEAKRYLLTGGRYLDICLEYDPDIFEDLDTSVLGEMKIPVSLPPCLQGLGLENEEPFTFHIRIQAPDLPIIDYISQKEDILTFLTWDDAAWESGWILWCSEDEGATWTNITGWEKVMWCEDPFSGTIFQMDVQGLEQPILLVLENSAGWGNVVSLIPGENGVISMGPGGDRDGGDREELPGSDGGEHNSDNTGGAAEDDSKENGPREDGSEENGSKEDGSKEDESKEDGSKKDGSEEDESKGDGTKENSHIESPAVKDVLMGNHSINNISVEGPPSDEITGGFPGSSLTGDTYSHGSSKKAVSNTSPVDTNGIGEPAKTPVSEQDTEKKTDNTVSSANHQAADGTELLLSVLVLCTAGVISVFATFRKKTGERRCRHKR